MKYECSKCKKQYDDSRRFGGHVSMCGNPNKQSLLDWRKIQEYYNLGYFWKDVSKKFNIGLSTIRRARKKGLFKSRRMGDSLKISHDKRKELGITIPLKIEMARRDKIRNYINNKYKNGWVAGGGRCKFIEYVSKITNKKFQLQGTWELLVAESLDDCNEPWIKNYKTFRYVDELDKQRLYMPDFYLPNKNIYIEVKGYQTERDILKWKYFPEKLVVLKKKEIWLLKESKQNLIKFLEETAWIE